MGVGRLVVVVVVVDVVVLVLVVEVLVVVATDVDVVAARGSLPPNWLHANTAANVVKTADITRNTARLDVGVDTVCLGAGLGTGRCSVAGSFAASGWRCSGAPQLVQKLESFRIADPQSPQKTDAVMWPDPSVGLSS